MEFQSVGRKRYVGTWKKFYEEVFAPGDGTPKLVVEGKYLGSTMGKFDKPMYEFEEADGTIAVVYDAGLLNYLVEEYLSEGTVCRVLYVGKEILQKGKYAGKDSHQFDIQLAKSSPVNKDDDFSAEAIEEDEFEGI